MNKHDLRKSYVNRIEGHALVLGGSGGIGKEIVLALAANGASAVSFTYGSNEKAAKALAKELRAFGVKKVYYAQMSIPRTDSEVPAFEQFLEDAVKATGEEISVFVNTVAISPNQTHAKQTIEGRHGWRDVYEVNVFGSFITMRSVAQRMKNKNTRGSITVITSTNRINSQAEFSVHYDSSKAALWHKAKTLAEKYIEYGIRVNGVAPGWTNTAMNDTVPKKELKKERSKIWLRRFAEPREIAIVVAFVAGTGGSYIVGQDIVVDGGSR